MSGRSAYVRKQNLQQADKRAFKESFDYGFEDPYLYGYTGAPVSTSRPAVSSNPSYTLHSRRRSASSASSSYGYPLPHVPSHMRKPRPIIVASAIEKSDFRTHLDGMSSSLRGKIGGLIKGKKEPTKDLPRLRPGTSTAHSDFGSRSTDFTPSIGAVPSLSTSTTPSEGQETYSTGHHAHSLSVPRQRQPQESVIHKIRRFEGGGKLPQLGWKSLSNVRIVSWPIRFFRIKLLIFNRILNCGTRMVTLLSTCTCVALEQNHHLRSELTPESLRSREPRPLSTNFTTSQNLKVGRSSTLATRMKEAHLQMLWIWTVMVIDLQLGCVLKMKTLISFAQLVCRIASCQRLQEASNTRSTYHGPEQKHRYTRRYGILPLGITLQSCTMRVLWSVRLCMRP